MKYLSALLALIFTASALAGAPYGIKGQKQASAIYSNVHQAPNNQVTNLGGINALIETGNKNLLTNPSFEHSVYTTGWVVGGSPTLETTAVIDGSKALTFAAQSAFSLIQVSSLYNQQLADGVQALAMVRIKTTETTIKVCSVVTSVTSTTNCVSHSGSGKWELLKVPFITATGNNGISIAATATTTTPVTIDEAFVGAVDLKTDTPKIEQQWSMWTSGSGPFAAGTFTGSIVPSNTFGSGIFSYNSSTGLYTVLKTASIAGSCSVQSNAATLNQCLINFKGTYIAGSNDAATGFNNGAASFNAIFSPGDTFNAQGLNSAYGNATFTVVASTVGNSSTYSSNNADFGWTQFIASGTWTTNSTYTGKFRRVGDTMEVMQTVFLSGAPNATTVQFNIPAGYTIDANKLSTLSTYKGSLGSATVWQNGVIGRGGAVTTLDATRVMPVMQTGEITATSPHTFTSNDAVSVRYSVPIVGWEQSNIIIGQFNGLESCKDSYECTDTYSAKVSPSGVVSDENIDWITGSCALSGTNSNLKTCTFKTSLFTVAPNCVAQVKYNGSAPGGGTGDIIYDLGVTTTGFTSAAVDILNSPDSDGYTVICQKTGADYIGKTAKAVASDQHYTKTVSDTLTKAVSFRAYRFSLPFPTVGTPFIFSNIEFDTDGGFNITTGQYTVKKPGTYYCHALVDVSHTSAAGAYMNIGFALNGSVITGYNTERAAASEVSRSIKIDNIIQAVVNDVIDVRSNGNGFTGITPQGDGSIFGCTRTGWQ